MSHQPLVIELSPLPKVLEAFRAVSHWPAPFLLDSALIRDPVGRYSYVMADPVQQWRIDQPEFGRDPFLDLEQALSTAWIPALPDLPPFQGGIAGLLGYELGRCWEQIPSAAHDEFQFPVLSAGLYDWVLAWDHLAHKCWLIVQHPGREPAQQRAERVLKCLEHGRRGTSSSVVAGLPTEPQAKTEGLSADCDIGTSKFRMKTNALLETRQLTPQWAAPGLPGLLSNFSQEGYLSAVAQVIEYIRAGDIFQANLTQRLLYPLHELNPIALYEQLRAVNPAPFAGMLLHDDWAVISASPERFLRVQDGVVETRPIKGTRRRPKGAEADLFTQDELRNSEKDLAENVMIVDLLRNDLSRVCQPGTLRVPQLCAVESYRTVQHLVSEIRGELRPGKTVWDLFRGAFPGGSITGAPKVRAMQIIAELEPTVRGPYTGSFFTVGFSGNVDSNLLIRTFAWKRGWLQCGVGGGVVAQSDPFAEYEETLHKAAGMLQALR